MSNNIEDLKKEYVGISVVKINTREKFKPFCVKRDGTGLTELYSFEDILILRELIDKVIKKYIDI